MTGDASFLAHAFSNACGDLPQYQRDHLQDHLRQAAAQRRHQPKFQYTPDRFHQVLQALQCWQAAAPEQRRDPEEWLVSAVDYLTMLGMFGEGRAGESRTFPCIKFAIGFLGWGRGVYCNSGFFKGDATLRH